MSQLRLHYRANRLRNAERKKKKFANMRAAKERKRIERAAREEPMPDTSHVVAPRPCKSGFRVTITCLDDGARVTFKTLRLPWGLSIPPTTAGRMLACVLANYRPA